MGAGKKAQVLIEALKNLGNARFAVLGCIPFDEETSTVSSQLLLSQDEALLQIAQDKHADEIVVALDRKQKGFPTDALLKCRFSGIEVTDIVTFYEREIGKIKVDWISPSWFIFADGFQYGKIRKIIKNGFDKSLAIVLLLFF